MFPLIVRTVKTAFAAIASLLVAQLIGLDYSATAAIIAILSVQDTRVSTSQGVIERIISAILALTIGSLIIIIFNSNPFFFGLYLLLFVPLSFLLGVEVGLGPSSVLVTHLFAADEVTGALLINEIILTFIGTGFALLTNVYAPSTREQLDRLIIDIDEDIIDILKIFGKTLTENLDIRKYKDNIDLLDSKLEVAGSLANTECDNNYCDASRTILDDIRLRQNQLSIIQSIYYHIDDIPTDYTKGHKVGYLLYEISEALVNDELLETCYEDFKEVEEHLENKPLPKTYEEFLIRANLQHIFEEFKDLVKISSKIQNKIRAKTSND